MSQVLGIQSISPQDALEHLCVAEDSKKSISAFLDVRSEGEFSTASIPGFVNFPILNNDERHQVGLTYKKAGREAAVELGFALVNPYRDQRVQSWLDYVQAQRAERAIVSCWRGGMRSRFAAEWLAQASSTSVCTVHGGYKAIRNLLLKYSDPKDFEFVIAAGFTGAQKTELLQSSPHHAIDLEALAHHRGSSFGRQMTGVQPAQASFENRIFLAFENLRQNKRFTALLEDESLMIGDVAIPRLIKQKMQKSPIVLLDVPVRDRAVHLAQEYVIDPMESGFEKNRVKQKLADSIWRISRKLGGLLSSQILAKLDAAFESQDLTYQPHVEWVEDLLSKYYDPQYARALEKLDRPILYRGSFKECFQWIQNRFV